MEDISLTTMLVGIGVIALWVVFGYKKSQRNFRNQKGRRFSERYREKRKSEKAE